MVPASQSMRAGDRLTASFKRTGTRGASVGILLVLMTALISGVSNFVNFGAVKGTNVDAFLAVRNGAVALMLLPFALFLGRASARRLSRGDWLRLAGIGLLGGAVPFVLFFQGLQMAGAAPAGNATFPYRTLFLMAMVLGVAFLKERLSPRLAVGMGVLLAGNALLLTFTGPIWTDGTVLILAATGLWAVEYALSKRTLRSLPSRTVALGRMGFGGLFLLGYLALRGEIAAVGALQGQDWQNVFLSAVLLTGFVVTWYAGLKEVDLSVATSVLVLATPITTVLAAVFDGRTYSAVYAAGLTAIVLGVVAVLGLASLRDMWTYLSRQVRLRAWGARHP